MSQRCSRRIPTLENWVALITVVFYLIEAGCAMCDLCMRMKHYAEVAMKGLRTSCTFAKVSTTNGKV
jgi:hypothetical protein